MKSVNYAFLGSEDVAATLGKKGTRTDLSLFDRKEADTIRTWVVPHTFPEKIQPLLQAINLAEHIILHVESLDRYLGEQVMVLDMLGMRSGILSHTHGVDRQTLLKAVRGTVVQDYTLTDTKDLRQECMRRVSAMTEGPGRVVTDHSFDVHGVGTVILGKVISGTIHRHDTMQILPSGLEVVVKSIQMHGTVVESASSPARVGLALKGVKPDDIPRGSILCHMDDVIPVRDTIRLDYNATPFYKGRTDRGQMCLASVGLQVVPGTITSDTEPLLVSLGRPLACDDGQTVTILRPDSDSVRISGSGTII